MKKVSEQQGSVLILALLLLVMVEVVLVSILSYHHFGILYTKDLKQHSQAVELLLGGEKWAAGLLKQVKQEKIKQSRYTLSPTETPFGVIQGVVWDAQALVNLNNFQRKSPKLIEHYLTKIFQDNANDVQALQSLFVGVETNTVTEVDKQDQEQAPAPEQQQESTQEQGQQSSIPSMNTLQMLYSVTELLTRTNVSTSGFETLLANMVVLPEYTGLNINTAIPSSLYSLSPDITQAQVETIVNLRQQNELSNLSDLKASEGLGDLSFNENDVVFDSQYYLAEITVIQEEVPMKLYTLMKVTENQAYIDVEVLWRSLGTR